MSLKSIANKFKLATKIFLFVVVSAIIVQLFPNQNKFRYQFEAGKPWSYDLITSTFDFPIYKSDDQVAKESEEVLKNYTPFYQKDTTLAKSEFIRFRNDWIQKYNQEPPFAGFIRNRFEKIYASGILSENDYNQLLNDKRTEISCISPDRITSTVELEDIYTPKTALEEFLRNSPDLLSHRNADISTYLIPNLKYDSITSQLSKNDLLKNISLTSGMIHAGEKIIDRGEIVTPELYQVLRSLKDEYEKRRSTLQQSAFVIAGEIAIVLALLALFFLYIYLFRPRIFDSFNNIIFISLLILMEVGLTTLIMTYTSFSYYVVPFVLLPIIVRVFFDSRTALFAHIITMLILSLIVDNSFQFILLQITTGMVAVSSLRDMTQRSQLAQTALYIFLTYSGMYLALQLFSEGDIHRVLWQPLMYFAISSFFLLFAYLLIYIFEKLFGLISSITLVELTNINSDLMMKFAEVAPGTFQHTLQVSNLATEAAKKINANSLLVRTGALYHDIGKMLHPEYFTENQLGGKNPLSEMDYEEAARIVISHVTEGIQLAKKTHLPEQIINFIATHHGTSKTMYFYNSFINANPGVAPNDQAYTYPGPIPNNKEAAILMMADAVEARSRSLQIYTEDSINDMVEKMIDGQIADGQFKEAPITFRDVETVKAVFKEKIKNIYHTRIVYPEVRKAGVDD